jgi:alcohol dehydrogenase class IV
MNFEFATAARIVFGPGRISELADYLAELGKTALVVTGRNTSRATQITGLLEESGLRADLFSVPGEPTVKVVKSGVAAARSCATDVVIGFGGGSAIDAAKAIAALATNEGDPYEYLEVIGKGNPLTSPPLPTIAIPTTAGTGAEVTKNSVLASPRHRVKVSLRHPLMLPRIALVDPELTHSLPPDITAFTGLDALTQLIEPYTSCRANPMTDGFCLEGIRRAARSLRLACEDGKNKTAREDMALASLLGGLALANSGLGMVHGFAGPLGGMFPAPHGAVCASLLPHVMRANVAALREGGDAAGTLDRYRTIAQIVTGQAEASIDEGIAWIEDLCNALQIPGIRSFGIETADFPEIVEKSSLSSSAKGNPVPLTADALTAILEHAF